MCENSLDSYNVILLCTNVSERHIWNELELLCDFSYCQITCFSGCWYQDSTLRLCIMHLALQANLSLAWISSCLLLMSFQGTSVLFCKSDQEDILVARPRYRGSPHVPWRYPPIDPLKLELLDIVLDFEIFEHSGCWGWRYNRKRKYWHIHAPNLSNHDEYMHWVLMTKLKI